MEQRFLRTQDPNLHKTEEFKRLVLAAVAIAPIIARGVQGAHVAAIIDEVANITAQLPPAGQGESLGQLVHGYMMYRFADGPEPEWHKLWLAQQDKEDEAAREG